MNTLEELLMFGISERGNTALTNPETGGMVFYAEVEEGKWLKISIAPENFPAWQVSTVEKSQSEIRSHIEENLCDTWFFQKNNIGANALNNSPVELEYVVEAVERHLYSVDNKDYATNDTVTVIHDYLTSREWTLDIEVIEKLRKEFDGE